MHSSKIQYLHVYVQDSLKRAGLFIRQTNCWCTLCCVLVCCAVLCCVWVVSGDLFGAAIWAIWRWERDTWADMWTGSGFFFFNRIIAEIVAVSVLCVSLCVGCAVLHCVLYVALCPAGGPARQTACLIYLENKTHEAAHTQIRRRILDLLLQHLRVEILVSCQHQIL